MKTPFETFDVRSDYMWDRTAIDVLPFPETVEQREVQRAFIESAIREKLERERAK